MLTSARCSLHSLSLQSCGHNSRWTKVAAGRWPYASGIGVTSPPHPTRSLGNFACQDVFVVGFSFSLMMPTYWLIRCLDNPVVRVTNSISGMCS